MGLIRTSFEVVTEESAAEGDAAERGWVDEDGEVLGVTAAIEWLRSKGPLEPSSSQFHKGIWYSGPSEQDMHTGEWYQEAYHLAGYTEAQQRRIYSALFSRRRNPHEQYYGDEEAPEDAERMRRLKAISDAAMRKNPRSMRRNEGTKTEIKQRKRELPIGLLYGDGAPGMGSAGNRKIVAVTAAGVTFIRTYGEYRQSSNGTEYSFFPDYESVLDHVKIAAAMGLGAKKIPALELQHMIILTPGHGGGGDGGESRYNPDAAMGGRKNPGLGRVVFKVTSKDWHGDEHVWAFVRAVSKQRYDVWYTGYHGDMRRTFKTLAKARAFAKEAAADSGWEP